MAVQCRGTYFNVSMQTDQDIPYRAIVENAGEAIIVVQKGRIRFCNEKALRLSGYSKTALLEKPCLQMIHPDDRKMVISEFRKALRSNYSNGCYSFRIINREGEPKWLEMNHQPTAWKGQRVVVCFASDITERRRLEQQFFQSQKMEAVGRLAGGIAHDFNNLLTVILGYTELLLGSPEGQKSLSASIEAMREAARKGATLTQNLLAFSRRQLLQPKVIGLNTLVSGMEPILKRLCGENIELIKRLKPCLGSVLADAGQIEQVILNLTVNSKDALEAGGKIVIETDNVDFSSSSLQGRPEMHPGPYVMLAISDTGTGMDESTKSHLFEPFFTTKESGRGTGLGLATVYGIVKQSNGFIYVYSEPGMGTTFKLYFPRIDDKPAERRIQDKPMESLTGMETILLLEDEPQVLKLVSSMLKKNGYTMLEAAGAAQALKLSSQHDGPIDLLIADIGIPGMNGRQVWEAVKERHPEIRVLFISGYPQDFTAVQDLSDSKKTFLQKPFGAETLLVRIREILEATGGHLTP